MIDQVPYETALRVQQTLLQKRRSLLSTARAAKGISVERGPLVGKDGRSREYLEFSNVDILEGD